MSWDLQRKIVQRNKYHCSASDNRRLNPKPLIWATTPANSSREAPLAKACTSFRVLSRVVVKLPASRLKPSLVKVETVISFDLPYQSREAVGSVMCLSGNRNDVGVIFPASGANTFSPEAGGNSNLVRSTSFSNLAPTFRNELTVTG